MSTSKAQGSRYDRPRIYWTAHPPGLLGLVRQLHEYRRHCITTQSDTTSIYRAENYRKDCVYSEPGCVFIDNHRNGHSVHQQTVDAEGIIPEPAGNSFLPDLCAGNRDNYHGHLIVRHIVLRSVVSSSTARAFLAVRRCRNTRCNFP